MSSNFLRKLHRALNDPKYDGLGYDVPIDSIDFTESEQTCLSDLVHYQREIDMWGYPVYCIFSFKFKGLWFLYKETFSGV